MQKTITINSNSTIEDYPGIHLYFRKIYNKEFKGTVGYETYMNLVDVETGIIVPDEYILISETSDQCVRLAYWELEAICRLTRGFDFKGLTYEWIAMVLSIKALERRGFAHDLINIIQRYKLQVDSFAFEISATSIDAISGSVVENVNILREKGASIIIREYGAVESNIMKLCDLPVDYCIIDDSLAYCLTGTDNEKKMYHNLVKMVTDIGIVPMLDGINGKLLEEAWMEESTAPAAMGNKIGRWFDELKLDDDRRKVRYK